MAESLDKAAELRLSAPRNNLRKELTDLKIGPIKDVRMNIDRQGPRGIAQSWIVWATLQNTPAQQGAASQLSEATGFEQSQKVTPSHFANAVRLLNGNQLGAQDQSTIHAYAKR
jgi:hypothetical protein